MAHRIFNGRFLENERKTAWHGLGISSAEPINAVTAYSAVGTYDVSKQPLLADMGDGTQIPTDYSIIVRQPTTDDPIIRVFGAPVFKDYELIDAGEAAHIWDRAMGNVGGKLAAPTETFGVLGKGEEVFITTKSKTLSIKGDEIDVYEFMYSPMYSGKAAVAGITPVRIVCANTLTLGMAQATQQFTITHTTGAKKRLEDALRDQHNNNLAMMDVVREAMLVLADKRIKDESQAKMLIKWVYPDPAEPQISWTAYSGLTMEQHEERYEEKLAKTNVTRDSVYGLFMGDGRGMLESQATNGTRFGLWNAVAEYETFRLGSYERTAVGLVAGDRGATIANAGRILMEYAG